MRTFNKTILATAMTLASTQAFAAGFQLNSQSATGIGRAMAGDAVIADNASVLARNPSAMALFDSSALSLGITYAATTVEVEDAYFDSGLPNDIGDANLGHLSDAADDKIIPNAFYIHPVNDTWAWGVAVFSNFGTGTDMTDLKRGSDAAADLLGNTEVTTININASVSMRVNEHLSLGAGLDVITGGGKIARDAQALPVSIVDVDASGVGFGGIVSATYEFNDNHRIGASYRFSPDVEADGDVAMAGTNFDNLELPLADIFQIAGFHQLNNKFAIHYTAQWTQWSNFDQIDVYNNDSDRTALKVYNWEDSWFLSIGGTYTINEKWTLRAGYAHDQGVVNDYPSVSIPDSDRAWYTFGVGYNLSPKSTIDLGVAIVEGETTEVVENSLLGNNLTAHTTSGATYMSVQYSYRF
ncbi:OmpP1/FadL family transporter [Ferrimonas aestuarii]|uniref:Transporter n=1 Tax=Ferrimonas aestuarii TaxID=2569539 RepID=A0A4U1BP15_9GAMM|nr:outer membrane protein transport protein [Ferrimonas aestuarii]TKB55530.1 transporter [Ferrimonas aestuarii]